MALEDLTGTKYIDDLNSSNPTATDVRSEGDDHIRGIKNVLKTTFPNINGAITSTQAELNLLDGVTSTTGELNYLAGATSGTVLTDGDAATTSAVGPVELATSAETITGTDTARATTPAGVKAAIDASVVITSGTWTPTIQDTTGSDAEGQTYATHSGNYFCINDLCYITGYITMSSLGTLTTSEQARIGGLPFTTANQTGSITIDEANSLNITAGQVVGGYIGANSTQIFLTLWDATTGTTDFLLSELTASGYISFSGMCVKT